MADETPIYFYTTDYPHHWTSGPSVYTLADSTYESLVSLEEAREHAIRHQEGKPGEKDYVATSYGVMFKIDPEATDGA